MTSGPEPEYEYVVVGSGAGGGTVAARLAAAGRKVLLLEAGGDPCRIAGGDPVEPDANRLPDDYEVPAYHAFASENEAMKWDFFVRHYADPEQQRRDPKFVVEKDGVLYPRAGTLGGCTAHNALIFIAPNNEDFDPIAESTGDDSWRGRNMRRYLERLEDCRHRPPYRWLAKILGWNPTRHGFAGWLATERAIPRAALDDRGLMDVVAESALGAMGAMGLSLQRFFWALRSQLDPNDYRLIRKHKVQGLHYVPVSTRRHGRNGTREFLLEVAEKHPDCLTIELDALATRVLLDDELRAVGVEYLKGASLYRASGKPSAEAGEPRTVRASREVVLSGGAFNTPQLLMLSGVGPREELERHGIEVRVALPGVGRNLQDRYEVGVVNRMKKEWEVYRGTTFTRADAAYREWAERRDGPYTSNGAVISVITRSQEARAVPDLFLFALLAPFRGYYPGYSAPFAGNPRYLTWAILKGYTVNRAGRVTLRSADPRDTPEVNFHYFEEGDDAAGDDLEAVVDGVELARRMTHEIREHVDEEELPGASVRTRDEIRRFVKDHAWGHHASCTCPIGRRDEGGVVDGDFRVHGVKGLRVVDASVFPRIPGLFIVSAVYMIGEKAADVILAGTRGQPRRG